MPEKQTDSIVYWIRSDLRLSDNIALWEAAKSNKNLIVVYIKNLTRGSSKTGSAADTWINKSLLELISRYKKLFKINLNIYDENCHSIFEHLHKEANFTDLYINNTYDPEVDKIDKSLEKEFGKLFNIKSYNSSLLFIPNEVLNNSGSFFKVYTPFWKNALNKLNLRDPLPIPKIKSIYEKKILSIKQSVIDKDYKIWEKKYYLISSLVKSMPERCLSKLQLN